MLRFKERFNRFEKDDIVFYIVQILLIGIILFQIVTNYNQYWELEAYRSEVETFKQEYAQNLYQSKVEITTALEKLEGNGISDIQSDETTTEKEDRRQKAWQPTANVTVNDYLNEVGGTVKLRGTVLNIFKNEVTNNENWFEISSLYIGINANSEGEYQEFGITNDRLYVRMPAYHSVPLGTEISIDARVIKRENNSKLGFLVLEGDTYRILSSKSSVNNSTPSTPSYFSSPQITPRSESSTSQWSGSISESTPSSQVSGSVYYSNCTEARQAGVTNIRRGDPGYGTHLDRDGDGIGCEY